MNEKFRRGEAERASMDEKLLRRVLTAEADRIEPGPEALPTIWHRIRSSAQERSRRWRLPGVADHHWRGWSPLAVGAVTAAALSVAAVAVGLASAVVPVPPDRAGPPPGAIDADRSASGVPSVDGVHPGPTPLGDGPAPPAGASAGTAAPGPATSTAALAVYYQGGDPRHPRLYREFHRL